MEEKQLMEVDEKEVAIIQFFRSLSNEQKETFCDFLITLKPMIQHWQGICRRQVVINSIVAR